jgi:mono/diheme cytochrome c family protein
MKKSLILAGAIGLVAASLLLNRTPPVAETRATTDTTLVDVTLPATLDAEERLGQTAFDAVCAACHGPNAAGRDGYGPPLVHRIYEPNHHADAAFYLAVQNGVRAHHWPFGNMPPQQGLTRADVTAIIAYVRALQRANGIE